MHVGSMNRQRALIIAGCIDRRAGLARLRWSRFVVDKRQVHTRQTKLLGADV